MYWRTGWYDCYSVLENTLYPVQSKESDNPSNHTYITNFKEKLRN